MRTSSYADLRSAWRRRALATLAAVAATLVACDTEPRPLQDWREMAGGDAARGSVLFARYGCTSCHTIPGVRQANGKVGPPLTSWSQRRYIAGTAPNTPENLILFIRDPDQIRPGTAMPNVGATERDARNMAAYLYTLR